MTAIEFDLSRNVRPKFSRLVEEQIENRHAVRVLEVGAGANPTLCEEFIHHCHIDYTCLDISDGELKKAPIGYRKVVGDIMSPPFPGVEQQDLIFSTMLAEHVTSGEAFHRNIRSLLKPGGTAIHIFPTLYAFPFVLNYLLSEELSELVLHVLQKGRETHGQHAKFRAYYDWCRGPTEGQIRRLQSIGFRIEKYIGLYGYEGYFARMPLIAKLHLAWAEFLANRRMPIFTSFAYLVLRKV